MTYTVTKSAACVVYFAGAFCKDSTDVVIVHRFHKRLAYDTLIACYFDWGFISAARMLYLQGTRQTPQVWPSRLGSVLKFLDRQMGHCSVHQCENPAPCASLKCLNRRNRVLNTSAESQCPQRLVFDTWSAFSTCRVQCAPCCSCTRWAAAASPTWPARVLSS